jgi:nitrite reductase/ring-hydroxylating ferredoxin subunit
LNRRKLLTYLFLIAVVLCVVAGLIVFIRYAVQQVGLEYVWIGTLEAYPPAEEPYVVYRNEAGLGLFLVNTGSELIAFKPYTPHDTRCILPWSSLTGRFEDPCTASKFRLDGTCIEGPATRNMDRYPVKIVGGQILINISRVIQGEPHP